MEQTPYFKHNGCAYNHSGDAEYLRSMELAVGENVRIALPKPTFLILKEGIISVFHNAMRDQQLSPDELMFFPPGGWLSIEAATNSRIILMQMDKVTHVCEKHSLESLHENMSAKKNLAEPSPLRMHHSLKVFAESLQPYLDDGLRCGVFVENKSKELLYLLVGYYTRSELASFFAPLLTRDMQFSNFVWENYRKARTVEDFARLSNYSLSMFKQKFKDVFGISPLKWMNEQRARNIYYELRMTEKSLEQIAEDNNFTSVSYLCTFCRNNLNNTATGIRRAARNKAKTDAVAL